MEMLWDAGIQLLDEMARVFESDASEPFVVSACVSLAASCCLPDLYSVLRESANAHRERQRQLSNSQQRETQTETGMRNKQAIIWYCRSHLVV